MRRGTRVGQAYVALHVDGSSVDKDIVDSIDDADYDKAGDRAGEKFGNKFGARWRETADKAVEKGGKEFEQRMAEAGDNGGDAYARRFGSTLRRHGKSIGDDFGHVIADRLELSFASLLDSLESRLDDLVSRNRGSRGPRPGRDDDGRGIGATVERFLGGGSRNNFLNFIGQSAGNVANVFESIFKKGSKLIGLTGVFEKISASLGDMVKQSSILQKIGGIGGGAVAEGFSAIAASGPGAVIAIGAVISAISVLVTLASALLALLTALAAVIAGAFVAALGVGAAALGAVGLAAGLAVVAFTNLDNAQKKILKNDFSTVIARFRGLAQVLTAPIFDSSGGKSPLEVWADNIDKAIRGLGPLAHIMGQAFAQAGEIITAGLSGRGFAQFFSALSQQTTGLSVIVKNLSVAFSEFLNGVLSVFAVLTPQVAAFSHWLADLATRFATFTASAEGQDKISAFFDRSIASLKSFLNFLNAVGDLLGKLLLSTQAQGAGQTIFDSMTQGIRNFIAYLTPTRLQHWFDEGVRLAKALGQAIKAVGIILADLNNSGVIDAIVFLAQAAERGAKAFSSLPLPIKAVLSPLYAVGFAAKAISFAFKAVGTVVLASIGGILAGLGGLFSALGHLPGKMGSVSKTIADGLNSARDSVFGLAEQIDGLPTEYNLSVNVDTTKAAKALNQFLTSYAKSLGALTDPNAATKPAKGLSGLLQPSKMAGGKVIPVQGTKTSGSGGFSGGGNGIPLAGPGGYGKSGGGGSDAASKAKQQAQDIASIYASIRDGVKAAAKAASAQEVRSSIDSMIQQMKEQSKEFNKAGKERVAAVTRILRAQQKLSKANVDALTSGKLPKGATLEDFARAREIVAARLEKANQKLKDAIALRDDYRKQITDSIKSFGELTTAQAKTIDGVEQALTANDIVTNLQDRLDKIKAFQNNLRILLAEGLSNAAYKQLLDAGVEEGGTFAQALVSGGAGAVQQVNSLTAQINSAANSLGVTASNRMYQAGVDAAKGLVDGLESLSAKLDSAAVRLGNSIARAVKNALGIHSPSRVMHGLMYDGVGDGVVLGLDQATRQKIEPAAARLASAVAVSPEVASYASRQGQPAVSGNAPGWVWTGDIVTPTEDPVAVATEVLNELTGRL